MGENRYDPKMIDASLRQSKELTYQGAFEIDKVGQIKSSRTLLKKRKTADYFMEAEPSHFSLE